MTFLLHEHSPFSLHCVLLGSVPSGEHWQGLKRKHKTTEAHMMQKTGYKEFPKKKKKNAKLNFVLMLSKLTYNLSVKTQRSLAGICRIWDLSLQVYKCTGLLDRTVKTLTPQGHTYKADSHLKKSGGRSCHGIVGILDQLYFSCSFHSVHSQGSHHTHNCLLNHYSHTLKKQLWKKYILSVITRSFRLKPNCKDQMYSNLLG